MMERYQEYFAGGAMPELQEQLTAKFGGEQAEDLFLKIGARVDAIHADYQFLKNDAMQGHIRRSIAPAIGCYLVLTENGTDRQEAYNFVEEQFVKSATRKGQMFGEMTKRDDFYEFFFRYGKQSLLNDYPAEFWNTEMVHDDDTRVAFNIGKCIYWEAAQKYGCPELCEIFCKCDYVAMEGVYPKVLFERSQTLGTGGSCCDFGFSANPALLAEGLKEDR